MGDEAKDYNERRQASRRERYLLKLYSEHRAIHHSQNSLNESGWVGEIFNTNAGKVLTEMFGIDITELTDAQKNILTWDVIKITSIKTKEIKQRAKEDLNATKEAIELLKKAQDKVEKLDRGFRATTNISPFSTPDITLATLLYELAENQRAIEETTGLIKEAASKLPETTSHQHNLCMAAIDIFLRWFDDDMPKHERGMSYSPDYLELKTLADDESKNIVKSHLKDFLEDLKEKMVSAGVAEWDFGLVEPSRIAVARHEKNLRAI